MAQSGSVHWSSVPSAEDLAGDVGESAFGVCSGAASGGASGSRTSNRGAEPLRPQRIELPSYLNTPARRPGGEPLSDQEQMVALKRIQDLELLAQACRRSSKGKEEGRAHFSLGVMRDNLGHYQKAIESYNQFLRVCAACGDSQGCGLAYHCIGVDWQLLAERAAGDGSGLPRGSGSWEARAEMLRRAISFHNRHREDADSVGKFVAHLNIGLANALLGEREASTVSYQYALRYALELHSLEGQSLAVGSLGFSEGMYGHDPDKTSALIERYMELCSALKQPRYQEAALQQLGELASQRGEDEQSAGYFRQVMRHARERGDLEAELGCGARLGVASGRARMDDHLGEIYDRLLGMRA